MGWKFDDKRLRRIYDENKDNINMSYKDFKKMAQDYANRLIANVKKGIDNDKKLKQTAKE